MSDTPARLAGLSAVKLALLARKVRAESQHVLAADPIAVVGMACRVPGGGDTPARLWRLLCDGVDAVREVPADRWDAAAWYDPDPAAMGKSLTRWGGFLERIDGFDAAYFGILPREAERMDPQQRLVLEVALEALDDGGLSAERLRGSRTGVFLASYHNDYAGLQYGDLATVDARTLTGTLHSVLANRLSYFLDLRGPSVSIDTACSSSLVATHLACQSLRAGEIDVAVAGGVSLMITPDLMVSISRVGFMAPDGRCKTFDARADGFGRGEGCGVVVLKRLADAIADGDRVLAVVRGSAVNQDGRSTVLAAPSGLAQQAMIVEALASAQLGPERVGFVETHGTGTALGDPIEVEALAATVGRPFPGAGPCHLGAIKANLGHLEAAAGVVGLIKAVLVLRHGEVPPQVHFRQLNPHISLAGTRLAIPTERVPWPAGPLPRCAAVSSFGVGGTNAHVIVEEAPRLPAQPQPPEEARVLPLSARGADALRALGEAWLDVLPATPASVADLCTTASLRRTHHDHRLAVVGRTREELRARLVQALAAPGAPVRAGGPRVAFVMSGQGPQWHAMGRELAAAEPVVRAALEEVDARLRPLSGWSLLQELAADESASRLQQTEVAQPALFALQIGLAALLRAWGLVPDAVVGHSVGEIAALHVAGALSLADAVRVVWHRGRIMQQATDLGGMAQVRLSPDEADALVRPFADRLSVGAVNAPRSVVLSGERAALDEALAALSARGVAHQRLPVRYAFHHGAGMAPLAQRLAAELADLPRTTPAIPVYSTVTGARATGDAFDGAYVGRNVRAPVRFASAIEALAADGFDVFVELSPHPVLAGAIDECLEAGRHAGRVVATLRRGRPEREAMLHACASLYVAGCAPAWEAVQDPPGGVTDVPAYPWQRRRYWLQAPAGGGSGTETGHPLLGRRLELAGLRAHVFEGGPDAAWAWLADHRIFGRLLLPGAAVLEAFHAAAEAALGGEVHLVGFAMERPLVLGEPAPGQGRVRWQIVVDATGDGPAGVALHEALPGGWRRVASAQAERGSPPALTVAAGATEPVALDAVHARFAALGVAFGPTFRCLRDVRRGDGVAEGWIDLPPGLEAGGRVHPVMLDAALQLCSIAAAGGPPASVLLPLGADRFALLAPAPARVRARARVRVGGEPTSLTADVILETDDGARVASIEGMRFAPARAGSLAASDALHEVVWHPAAPAAPPGEGDGAWLLLADRGGTADALAAELTAAGARCVLAAAGDAFAQTAPDRFTVRAGEPDDLRRLLAAAGSAAPHRAVHLLALDVAPLDGRVDGDEDLRAVGSLLHLVQAMGPEGPLRVVTRGAQVASGDEPPAALRPRAAAAWGLASVVALERPELEVRCVDLDPAGGLAGLAAELRAGGDAPRRVALRGGARWVPRLEPLRRRARDDSPRRLEIVRAGTLDGVELRAAPRVPLGPGEVRLGVLAAGLNFRDVLQALGMLPGPPTPLGFECAGVVLEAGARVRDLAPGARVVGLAPGSLATEVTVPAAFLVPLPPGLDVDQAAALPVAFLTGLYGFDRLAGLRAGQRVLIHGAAGGVGLAAVALARRRGAEVFATAGSPAKRDHLRALGIAHVMDSRSGAFADEIRAATGGAGVDVVLNSLSGELLLASLGVVARGGCFLELGKRDILTPEAAARLRPDVRYHAYDLGVAATADPSIVRPMLGEVLAAVGAGALRPLPVSGYPLAGARDALRFMAQARHIGKIVVRPPASRGGLPDGAPLVTGDATYWITGGLGALGLETARWLARAGARTLVLSGRRPPSIAAAQAVAALEQQGVRVKVVAADASDRARMAQVLAEIDATSPPLRGVVHAAGTVDDGVLAHQTWARGRGVLAGKAGGAYVLHELTRDRPLDFFILYSAAGLLLGAPGQGAYPAANAALDALALARRAGGLPALSVAWGVWGGAGMGAELAARGSDVWAARGLGTIAPAEGLAALEQLLREGVAHAAVMPIDWSRFLATLPPGAERAFFSASAPGAATPVPTPARASIVARLRALPAGLRRAALVAHLVEQARSILGRDAASEIGPTVALKELGLDSLMAVELRNTLSRSLGQPLPATLLFDHPTIDALAGQLARTLALDPEAPRGAPADVDELAGLSDDEAEALLLAELDGATPGRRDG